MTVRDIVMTSAGLGGDTNYLLSRITSSDSGLSFRGESLGSTVSGMPNMLDADSSGNVYLLAQTGGGRLTLLKINILTGTVAWYTRLASTTHYPAAGIVLDASGSNLYFGAYVNRLGKVSASTGSIAWYKEWYPPDAWGGTNYSCGIGIDGSSNIFWPGFTYYGSALTVPIVTTTPTGDLNSISVPIANFTSTSQSITVNNIIRSGSNYILSGWYNDGSYSYKAFLRNTNNTINYTYSHSPTALEFDTDCAVDGLGNVYTCFGHAKYSPLVKYITIAKYNSTGTELNKNDIVGGSVCLGGKLATDSSNNLYLVYYNSSSYGIISLTKFNTNLVPQWTRSLRVIKGGTTVNSLRVPGIKIKNDKLYLYTTATSGAGSTSEIFLMVLPTDGTKEGTYQLGDCYIEYLSATNPSLSTSIVTTTNSGFYNGNALAIWSGTTPSSATTTAYTDTTTSTTNLTLSPAPTVQYLIVAGGGGGGGGPGGGGGAGGFLTSTSYSVSGNIPYTISVGSGGSGSAGLGIAGSNGGNSSFAGITATGGGGGGSYTTAGSSGGSGGGGGSQVLGGTGTSGQGNAGGNGSADTDYSATGGGGGGSFPGATGYSNGVGTGTGGSGNGGGGTNSQITGSSIFYSGGGGGGARADYYGAPYPAYSISPGNGGNGGGGAGGQTSPGSSASPANRGGGGGGGGYSGIGQSPTSHTGGSGSSGIVIVRYPMTYRAAIATTGAPTVTQTGIDRVYTFTGSGSITF